MGKSARAQNARLEELRVEQDRSERTRRLAIAGATVAIVVLIAVSIVFVALQSDPEDVNGQQGAALNQSTFTDLTTVPASVFNEVGAGSAQNGPRTIDAEELTADGKPRIIYVGAEFCPYCASQRWALIVALSRFGEWENLHSSYSGPAPEIYPNTPTVTFRGATYSSDYVSFTGYETHSNRMINGQWEPLDKLEGEDKTIYETLNGPDYTERSGIPWMTIGGTSIQGGASYRSEPLMGRSHAEIAAALHDPTTELAQGVNGAANLLSAQICRVTDNQPTDVCESAGVKAAEGLLQ